MLSWQMATQPLSDEARKTIIPGRQSMSDTHGELYFARYDARNRLVTGGPDQDHALRRLRNKAYGAGLCSNSKCSKIDDGDAGY